MNLRIILICLLGMAAPANALEIEKHEPIQQLIRDMSRDHNIAERDLRRLFARVQLRPRVIELISKPSEGLPWYRYRKIFINDRRIQRGVAFWRQHEQTLRRAEAEFGVPAAVIVAIIGVETGYGENIGRFPVIDALTTLTLQYPRRSKFFRGELEKFILLVVKEGLDPYAVMGSYAGAIGVPQFMPSSYLAYAVDFNQDNKRDLVSQMEDAIGSVANYLSKHRWRKDAPVAGDVRVRGAAARLVNRELKLNTTVGALRDAGVDVQLDAAPQTKASLIALEQTDQSHLYRAVFHNFYVITRYNRSLLYASAVYELSEAVARLRAAS